MTGAKDTKKTVGRSKKQKPVLPVWRAVSTKASSSEVKDVPENLSQVQKVHSHDVNKEAEDVYEIISSAISSRASQDNDQDQDVGSGSTFSAEKHSTSVAVNASLFRFIRGKGGSMQKDIEEEMGVKIIFLSSKKENSVIVEGMSSESVKRASEKIQAVINEAVTKPYVDYSHFVSLPLAIHPGLVDKLVNFQSTILGIRDPNPDEILLSDRNEDTSDDEDKDQQKGVDVAVKLNVEADNEYVNVDITNIPLTSYLPKASKSSTISDLGIDKSIFIKPKTFHLTVLMLKLWNKDRVDAATEVLRSVSSKVMDALDGRPISVRLKGLDCMRGSLAKARVLYAPVEEVGLEDRLLRACHVIIDAYTEAGLVLEKDAKHQLKLHATVMNARHRRRKRGARKLDSFDARGIMEQYGSEEWGEFLIREAHLSQRFAFDENGYYHCCASIPFPENTQAE